MRLFTLLLLSAVCALGSGELSGRPAPGFSLLGPDGKLHDPQDYRGRVLIIDIMQTSCPHCAKFSVILEQAQAKYGDKIAVLSVVNPPSDPKTVKEYIAQNKIKSPILLDCGQVTYSYLKPTRPDVVIPHVFLIDRDGIIRNDFGWESNANMMKIFEGDALFAEIEKVLASKPGGGQKK